MNFRIAIIDDEPASHEVLSALALKWSGLRGHTTELERFTSAESFLFAYSAEKAYDILLLDVEMDGMSGVELAKQLRSENKIIQIIFITAYSDYISEGYEVAALHYLLKPVDECKLFQTMDRACERLKTEARVVTIKTTDETVRIPIYEIRYAEVLRNYVTVHAQSDYTAKMPLTELVGSLDERFLRIGRSYVVNLGFIRRVTKTEVHLRSGETVPLPRGAYETVNRAIINMK